MVRYSPTGTVSKAAPPDALHSSSVNRRSAPALRRWACPLRPEGMNIKDPTIADLLKNHGYMTGQFGKNHLGDRDEMFPTNHAFDEFFGNFYHLKAEEEPERPDYPKEKDFPNFKKNFQPRGIMHAFSDGRVEDTGPLTKKRIETFDE